MKILKDRILKDGKCYPGGILKVDNFINHQMDPILMTVHILRSGRESLRQKDGGIKECLNKSTKLSQ